ncbi:MAG: transcriptional activator NhaR [Isosphaeraceae bacterium]
MEWLNYHHLLYFWTVVREGSIARACERLHLAQPTVSAQIQALEKSFGSPLFDRVGRRLVLTETGQVVYRYADEIFTLGRELTDALKGRPTGRPLRLAVGIADALPKLVTYRLLEPVLRGPDPVQLVCFEGKPGPLLADLAVHELDLVLSDAPVGPDVSVKAYSHLLGDCGISFFVAADRASAYRDDFPQSLDDAPMLLPTQNTTLRRSLDHWFESQGLRPNVAGEFEDSALLKVFGQQGIGIFAAPSVIDEAIQRQYDAEVIGRAETIRERYYAISVERRLKHPGVVALTETARRDLFGD